MAVYRQVQPLVTRAGQRAAQSPPYLEALIQRLAAIFHAEVCVLGKTGIVLGSSKQGWRGRPFSELDHEGCPAPLRLPIVLDGRRCEVAICGLGERISPRLAQTLVDMTLSELLRQQELPARAEIKNRFIYDLLHGHIDDEATLSHYAELLGLDLSPPRAVILIDALDYMAGEKSSPQESRRRVQALVDAIIHFFHLPDDLTCAYLGDGQIVVLKASDRQNLSAWAGSDQSGARRWADLTALQRAATALLGCLPAGAAAAVRIGLGRHHPGPTGLAASYADAQAALVLGRRFHHQQQVHCLTDLGVAAFVGLADAQTKEELAQHLLSPLRDEPELVETLQHFFAEDCSLCATAARLYIHRNTLSYRLDKIASLTGLDPRCFDEAVQLRLALMVHVLGACSAQALAAADVSARSV